MLIINYKSSFKALNKYIDDYNDTKDHYGDKIKSAVAHTAKEIIRIYGASLLKEISIEEIDYDNLPTLSTNNIQLSKLTKASGRTIQRHIKKLQEAGIITNKEIHCNNRGYDLWITSKILLNNLFKTSKSEKNEQETDTVKGIDSKGVKENVKPKCPGSYTGYNSYTNNLLIAVNNINKSNSNHFKAINSTGNDITGYTGDQGVVVIDKETGDQAEKDWAGQNGDRTYGAEKFPAHRLSQIEFYVNLLWITARNVLYKGVFLTERQQKRAKELLFKWYLPVSEKNLSIIHKRYLDRIFIVKKYLEKDPENRYVQLPNRYFDPDNPHGFTRTKKWYKVHLKRKKEVSEKLILHAQIRKYTNNEKKDTSERKSSLLVFKECEQRVGELKNDELLKLFYMAVLKKENDPHLNFISTL